MVYDKALNVVSIMEDIGGQLEIVGHLSRVLRVEAFDFNGL